MGKWSGCVCLLFSRLARISHHPSTATTLCRTLHDFHSVRALNIISTMLAHPPNNVCRLRQSLLGVVAKDMQGTPYRRLATNGGEKYGLVYNSGDISFQLVASREQQVGLSMTREGFFVGRESMWLSL